MIRDQKFHSAHFQSESNYELDLHWHAIPYCCWENANLSFWDDKIPVRIDNESAFVLNPADQLLQTCGHGARWNLEPPLRWLADAHTIITAEPTLNWERLAEQASGMRLGLHVSRTLTYLKKVLQTPIPDQQLAQIKRLPISLIERLEYGNTAKKHRVFGRWPILWLELSRSYSDHHLWKRYINYPSYVRDNLQLEHCWQIPFYRYYHKKSIPIQKFPRK
jgi:hypothetical protein